MKKCLFVAVLALCFCACDGLQDDEPKEYTTQCESINNNDERKKCYEKECDEGNGAACYKSSWYNVLGENTHKYNFAKKSCDLKYALGCYYLADVIEKQDGIEKAKEYYKKAFKMLEKSCENNHNGASCGLLAGMYEYGKWVEKDKSKAEFYYEKGCKFNGAGACSSLGYMYYEGEGVEKDAAKDLSYHQKACVLDEWYCENSGGFYYNKKEYQKAISVYKQGCDRDDSESCKRLGNMYFEGEGVEKDVEKSLNYRQKACDLETSECYDAGWFYYDKKEYQKAVSFYKQGCDRDDDSSCYYLGGMYYKGEGVTRDIEKALNYHQKACDLDLTMCYVTATDFYRGKDNQKAVSFYKQGCDRGDSSSCKRLGDMYFEGKGMRDIEKALNYHQKACDLNPDYYGLIGYFYQDKDNQKAVSFYKQGCDRNDNISCYYLGGMYFYGKGVKQDFSKAFEYHKKGPTDYYSMAADKYIKKKRYNEAKYFMEKECENNCFNRGLESANNKDYIKARLYYEIACDKGDAGACNNLGVLYGYGRGVAKNNAKAKALYEKACNMNNAIACDNVGGYYYNAREFAKAKVAFEKGCEGNKANSCSNLGVLYEFGEGVRQDFSQAKAYYGKGCDGGSQRGCDGYRKLNQRGVK